MSQSEIGAFLEDNKEKWFTMKQIAERLIMNINVAKRNMNTLIKEGRIDMICMNQTFYYNYAPEFSALKLRNEIKKIIRTPEQISDIFLINAIEDLIFVQKTKYLIKEANNESIRKC